MLVAHVVRRSGLELGFDWLLDATNAHHNFVLLLSDLLRLQISGVALQLCVACASQLLYAQTTEADGPDVADNNGRLESL